MAHPLALQLRNLQSLVEIGVDKNTTVVFPAPLMSTIAELGSFLAREKAAATTPAAPAAPTAAATMTVPMTPANGAPPRSPPQRVVARGARMNTTITRVVVGVDGSPSSIDALLWAVRYAGLTGAEVEAVTTWAAPTGYGPAYGAGGFDAVVVDWADIARRTQDTALDQALPGGSGTIRRTVVCDHPAAALSFRCRGGGPARRGVPRPRRLCRHAPGLGQHPRRRPRSLPRRRRSSRP